MKRFRFLPFVGLVCLLLLSVACAETCEHQWVACGSGEYVWQETITEEGHVSVAYETYACLSCREKKVEPANNPLFPNRVQKHEYSQVTTAQVSSKSAVHTCKKWGCTLSASCSFYEIETHERCVRTDLGHNKENIHEYEHRCINADCDFSVIILQECDENCPIHIYRKRMEQEQQNSNEEVYVQ